MDGRDEKLADAACFHFHMIARLKFIHIRTTHQYKHSYRELHNATANKAGNISLIRKHLAKISRHK